MKKMKIKNVIIGEQYETYENYEEFLEIVKEKKTNVKVVNAESKIKIEDKLYFDVIWPNKKNMISKNAINNNSLVCKLVYKDFSMLFTGDIEEVAEKAILSEYGRTGANILNSTILKVAHHGSKTSSTLEFINAVNPKYALIGVGKNNKFGHPSDITISNLQSLNVQIYRTDQVGEIMIKTNGEKCKIEKFINQRK